MAEVKDTPFVSKTWVIAVLCAIVGALVMMGINNVFGNTSELKLKQDEMAAQVIIMRERISVVETNYKNIEKVLDEMRSDIKEIKKEVKK